MNVPKKTGFIITLCCCLATTTPLVQAKKKVIPPVHPANNTVTIINKSGTLGFGSREALVKAQYLGTIGQTPLAARKVLASGKSLDFPLNIPGGTLDHIKITDLKTESEPLILKNLQAGAYAITYDSKSTRWMLMQNKHTARSVKKRN